MKDKKEILVTHSNPLSIDDKLDRIMEAIVFQQQLHITTLKALDIILGKREEESTSSPSSKIIKPIGIL